MEERAREATRDAMRVVEELSGVGTETLGLWAELTQHIVSDVAGFTSNAAQESARQVTAFQQLGLDAWRSLQTSAMRWQLVWPEAFRDPVRWYQRSLEEGVQTTQTLFGLARRNAEHAMQSFERMEGATRETTNTLRETFQQASSKMQDVYGRAERLRAA